MQIKNFGKQIGMKPWKRLFFPSDNPDALEIAVDFVICLGQALIVAIVLVGGAYLLTRR